MDRNAILSGFISSFQTYSGSDSRETVEKVLKYSGGNDDLSRRADISREVVLFRLQAGTGVFQINDLKPLELNQNFEVLTFVEQGDTHSIKEARYDRLLELTDQIVDWSIATEASTINSDVVSLSLVNVGATQEQNGFLSTTLSFQSIITLQ